MLDALGSIPSIATQRDRQRHAQTGTKAGKSPTAVEVEEDEEVGCEE